MPDDEAFVSRNEDDKDVNQEQTNLSNDEPEISSEPEVNQEVEISQKEMLEQQYESAYQHLQYAASSMQGVEQSQAIEQYSKELIASERELDQLNDGQTKTSDHTKDRIEELGKISPSVANQMKFYSEKERFTVENTESLQAKKSEREQETSSRVTTKEDLNKSLDELKNVKQEGQQILKEANKKWREGVENDMAAEREKAANPKVKSPEVKSQSSPQTPENNVKNKEAKTTSKPLPTPPVSKAKEQQADVQNIKTSPEETVAPEQKHTTNLHELPVEQVIHQYNNILKEMEEVCESKNNDKDKKLDDLAKDLVDHEQQLDKHYKAEYGVATYEMTDLQLSEMDNQDTKEKINSHISKERYERTGSSYEKDVVDRYQKKESERKVEQDFDDFVNSRAENTNNIEDSKQPTDLSDQKKASEELQKKGVFDHKEQILENAQKAKQSPDTSQEQQQVSSKPLPKIPEQSSVKQAPVAPEKPNLSADQLRDKMKNAPDDKQRNAAQKEFDQLASAAHKDKALPKTPSKPLPEIPKAQGQSNDVQKGVSPSKPLPPIPGKEGAQKDQGQNQSKAQEQNKDQSQQQSKNTGKQYGNVGKALTKLPDSLKSLPKSAINEAKSIGSFMKNTISDIKSGVGEKLTSAKDLVSDKVTEVQKAPSKIAKAVQEKIQGPGGGIGM